MITLDAIKGTWMERPINCVIGGSGVCISEAATKPLCEIPKSVHVPPERGGKSRTNFIE